MLFRSDFSITDVSISSGTYTQVGTYGTLVVTESTGAWVYTLDDSASATQAIDAGDSPTDTFSITVNDNDGDYEDVDTSDDEVLVNGAWTDEYHRFAGDQYHLPNTGLGEYVYGWWQIDIDGDQIADGTDPTNWDTDGDWLNDFFEIEDDMLDGVRGNSGSPIRYDDRTTS